MPVFEITAPDGKTYEITAPEGATPEQALEKVKLVYQVKPQTQPPRPVVLPGGEEETYSPLEGMSSFEEWAAGVGSKGRDYALGTAQLLSPFPRQELQQEIDEKAKRDAPLAESSMGSLGMATTALVPALAASAIPGANTYGGSALIGGAMGLMEPVTSDRGIVSGKLANALAGAGAGFAGQAAGNLLAAGVRGSKGLIKPLFESGQEELADAIIQKSAHDPLAAYQAGSAYQAATPGVIPTLAESTLDPGVSALQRAATGTDVAARHISNRNVLVDALRSLGGTPQDYKAALQARSAVVDPLYAASDATMVPTDAEFAELLKRPEVKAAWARITENARNAGSAPPSLGYTPAQRVMDGLSGWKDIPESFGEISGQDLHSLKMALDGSLETAPTRGIATQDAKSVKAARDAVVNWIEARIPEYGQAKSEFARLSQPVNAMDVGQLLHDKLVPALSDAAGTNTRLAPSRYASALREADDLAAKATGFDGAKLAKVLTPSQMRTVEGIAKDLGREQAAYDAAMIRGSPTSRNLVTQNLIDQVAGSLGGGSKAQALARALLRIPSRAVDVAYAPISDSINEKIAQRLADSQLGLRSLQYQPNSAATDKLAIALARLGSPSALAVYGSQ